MKKLEQDILNNFVTPETIAWERNSFLIYFANCIPSYSRKEVEIAFDTLIQRGRIMVIGEGRSKGLYTLRKE